MNVRLWVFYYIVSLVAVGLPQCYVLMLQPYAVQSQGTTYIEKFRNSKRENHSQLGGGDITINPSYTYVHTIDIPMLHTPIQTMVYTNVSIFCSIHNHHKPMYHLYVLKPYISIHMYHAIGYTIVIYNRLQQLRYICYIHNPLYV